MSFTPSHEAQMFQPFKLFPHLFLSGCTGSLLLLGFCPVTERGAALWLLCAGFRCSAFLRRRT